MTSQKLENLLNLALNSAEDEREKSLNLNVGYDPLDREWDLIIKYSVNLDRVRKIASKVTELQNEYAVIRITESRIDILSEIPEVEYVEKPKRLFFQAAEGRRVSCINAVQDTRLSLYGQGILVAIIDSGIDYANIDFRNADGSTRIRYLWDQSLNPADGETAPVGYSIGVEYTKGQIDEALNAQTVSEQRRLVRSQDISGHGTAVAGVAAGNGSNSGGRYAGVAMQSELIVVKLGNPIQEGFPRTTELMMGIDYIIRKALELRMPVAVNISFGNTYGGHDGTTLLERYIDDVSNIWKSVFFRRRRDNPACNSEQTVIDQYPDMERIYGSNRDFDHQSIGSAGRTGTGDIGTTSLPNWSDRNTALLWGTKSLQHFPGNLYRSASGRKLSDRRNMENCSKCREDRDRTI